MLCYLTHYRFQTISYLLKRCVLNSTKAQDLQQVIEFIQKTWGTGAIGQISNKAANPYIATGIEPLDILLAGGIPRAYITSVWGSGTSGMTTLAYRVIASAQLTGDVVVFIDLPSTFDPEYATNYGVDFERVLLVYPVDWIQALSITRDVIALPCTGLVVFDAGIADAAIGNHLSTFSGTLERLNAVLHKSRWTLLLLLPQNLMHVPDTSVALRLITKRLSWLWDQGEMCGFRVQITVAKNKFRPAGQVATVDIAVEW